MIEVSMITMNWAPAIRASAQPRRAADVRDSVDMFVISYLPRLKTQQPLEKITLGGYSIKIKRLFPSRNRNRVWKQSRSFNTAEWIVMDSVEQVSQHGYITRKDDYLKRLRRIEGQARGLQGMVADEKYCIDILTQVSAMTKALQSVALGLLEEHMSHCVVQAAATGGTEADLKITEASDAIARLVRS